LVKGKKRRERLEEDNVLKRLNGLNLILMKLERYHVPLGYSLCILVKEREIFEYTDKEKETQGANSVGSYFTPKFNNFKSFFLLNFFCLLIDHKSYLVF
jgi:hypothetical protein